MVSQAQESDSKDREIASLRAENRILRAMLEAATSRPPEQRIEDARQLQLAEIVSPAEEAPERKPETPDRTSAPTIARAKGRRRRVPLAEKIDGLPVEMTTYIIPDVVKDNEELYREIEPEKAVEVIYRKPKLSLHLIVRRKFVMKDSPGRAPVVGKAPPRFSSSFVSGSLAVAIVLDKYSFHGTLYRMERKLLELGLDLSRKTQSDIVERFAAFMEPLYELMKRRALESPYLQIDETFIKYLNGKGGGGSTGYFWAVNDVGEAVVMTWIPDRKHGNVGKVLKNWIHEDPNWLGLLQSDGYEGYPAFAAAHPRVELLACWAHAFRKLRDALASDRALVLPAMELVGQLYKLEQRWDELKLGHEDRRRERALRSLPVAAAIRAQLELIDSDLSALPSSAARKAAVYALKRWDALVACLRHGHTRLDTNALERQFRDSAIGKKNWMFVGHPQAGQKSAVIYTLLACCKIHRVNPEMYLSSVLDQLVAAEGRPSEQLLESLLPRSWIATHPEAIVKEQARA